MAIPATLYHDLCRNGVSEDLIPHPTTSSSRMTARATHVPEASVTKAVGIKCKKGFVLAVIPSSREVALRGVGALLADPVCLGTEGVFQGLFVDCEVGAIPPLGEPYGIRTIVDRQLLDPDDSYFEGGDHRTVVHLKGGAFRQLMDKVPHRNISRQPRSKGALSDPGDVCYWGA